MEENNVESSSSDDDNDDDYEHKGKIAAHKRGLRRSTRTREVRLLAATSRNEFFTLISLYSCRIRRAQVKIVTIPKQERRITMMILKKRRMAMGTPLR